MATAVTNTPVNPPKIILYTNYRCPYAHRAHITLKELNLPFSEEIVDLDTPRTKEYLAINPRGLVPTIKYSVPDLFDEEIITESAIVAEFLCDAFPSHLLPSTRDGPRAPLTRARINFFIDTWDAKVASAFFPAIMAEGEAKTSKLDAWATAVEKEIEPLLVNAAPFFGGSDKLTFVEVHTGPFIARWYAYAEASPDLIPASFIDRLDSLPNFSKWAKAVREHPSVDEAVDWRIPKDQLVAKLGEIRAKMAQKK